MTTITLILASLAAIVIAIEFAVVFRNRADRKIWENLNRYNHKGE